MQRRTKRLRLEVAVPQGGGKVVGEPQSLPPAPVGPSGRSDHEAAQRLYMLVMQVGEGPGREGTLPCCCLRLAGHPGAAEPPAALPSSLAAQPTPGCRCIARGETHWDDSPWELRRT